MTSLSGGQAARAGLASLLLSRYDLFLLDEPTNDLDLDGLDRLEGFVHGLRAGTVVVSHDREFLARTVTKVLELDLAQQQIRLYGGGYAGLPGRARGGPAACPRASSRSTPTPAPSSESRARTQRAWMEKGVRNARRKAHRQRQDRPQLPRRDDGEAGRQGPPDGEADRAARGGRGAAQGVGAADGDRRRAPVRRGGGHAARRGGQAGRVHPRPGRPADRLGRAGGDHRGQRLGQVDAARRAARRASRWTRGTPRSGPAWSSARWTRPGGCSTARSRCCDAFARRSAGAAARRGADAAGQVRAAGRARAAARRHAVARRADPRRAGAAAGPRR